jgi:hypothetical protein
MALLPLRRKCALWIFITHKNPLPSVGFEPTTEYPVGPVASTLTTRPPRAPHLKHYSRHKSICKVSGYRPDNQVSNTTSNEDFSFCYHVEAVPCNHQSSYPRIQAFVSWSKTESHGHLHQLLNATMLSFLYAFIVKCLGKQKNLPLIFTILDF